MGNDQPPSRHQAALATAGRFTSIDLIRGAVMILMAIDHVRVYSGLPAGGPTPGIFFTRWVTHFCAPAFIFLAGTSAFLYGRRHPDLSRFLLTRGLWLVVLELTVLRWAWTFNGDVTHMMAGVIWVIGWCMILMAGLVRLPVTAVGVFGLAVIGLHNLTDPYFGQLVTTLANGPAGGIWRLLYFGWYGGPVRLGAEGGPSLIVLYSLVPWIGVMAAGYAFGALVVDQPHRRDRRLALLGAVATVLFLVLRGSNLYGDPRPWPALAAPGPDGQPGMPAILAFLNTNKYPASLAFLLMTLGPTVGVMPWLERISGRLAAGIAVFGRVPFFYYVLHIPLIHLLAVAVSVVRTGAASPWLFTNHPMGNPPAPDGYAWSLGLLYLVWLVTIALLYPACRWFADLKTRRKDWWLSYL